MLKMFCDRCCAVINDDQYLDDFKQAHLLVEDFDGNDKDTIVAFSFRGDDALHFCKQCAFVLINRARDLLCGGQTIGEADGDGSSDTEG